MKPETEVSDMPALFMVWSLGPMILTLSVCVVVYHF